MSGRIVIAMGDKHPISIVEAEWPILAEVRDACGEGLRHELVVRQHADGRRIVHCMHGFAIAGQLEQHGELVEPIGFKPDESKTLNALCRCGRVILRQDLARQCIAKLPPVLVD